MCVNPLLLFHSLSQMVGGLSLQMGPLRPQVWGLSTTRQLIKQTMEVFKIQSQYLKH